MANEQPVIIKKIIKKEAMPIMAAPGNWLTLILLPP